MANLSPHEGREQAGARPVLIVSFDRLNQGPSGLVIVVPFTSRGKDLPLHVRVSPPEGGLKVESWAECEHIRSISVGRLTSYLGEISGDSMSVIEQMIRRILVL